MPVPVPRILGHSDELGHHRAAGSRRRDAAGASRRGVAGTTRGALSPGGLLHRHAAAAWRRAGVCRVYPYGIAFDVEKLTWELQFFTKHFLEAYRGRSSPRRTRRRCRRVHAIVEELASEPRVLCHRDYHSRNLMLHEGSLYIIDFQDARMGPDTYDLVSLLRDSYVDFTEAQVEELIAFFLALREGRLPDARRTRRVPPTASM
jgi:aminoglycoside/choline kinase family phosphotransferase